MVKESENVMSVPTNHPYERVVNNSRSNPQAHKGGDNSSTTPYNKGDNSIIFLDNAYGGTDNNLISMGQFYNKEDNNLSIDQSYREICDTILMDKRFSKVDSNVISIAQTYNKADGNSMSRDHVFNKGEDGTISVGQTYCHKGQNNMPLVVQSSKKEEITMISFGGCDDDDTSPSGRFFSSNELLMGLAASHNSEALNEKQLGKSNSNSLISAALMSASGTENISKIKEEIKRSKKAPSNNFPSNVRSLLSTGMLDGVPVKYKTWSREKELQGVIKGSGYLCSCQSCNFSKLINAYEFERHAGCKTKHPNNHIYFENGKTVYGIVQELRSTPQNMIFKVIQTITGSPINQKSFHIWKDSFLVATQELQRIYGKVELKQLS
ncbi:uncharacterized protein LOC133287836 [Gastrolobium bilobum]|uniref:uncharacterized protein LOC133287836 n=1 Tax=Gastrolobium bilobum TaxID=150636 RepID=UPI002AAFA9DE|nr:uncharacterized protein LOC133287836 [Gastrolobium bilobum]